jgi:hypothetical protein
MLGGPQSLSGRGGEEKNSQSPPGIEIELYNPDRPARSRYTDWDLTAKLQNITFIIFLQEL